MPSTWSALLLAEQLTTFIAYDHRLADAARAAGLTVATSGLDPESQPH